MTQKKIATDCCRQLKPRARRSPLCFLAFPGEIAQGHATVFTKVRDNMGERRVACEAFPVGLVLSGDEKDKDDAVMKKRLSDSNFTGEIQQRTKAFVETVSS